MGLLNNGFRPLPGSRWILCRGADGLVYFGYLSPYSGGDPGSPIALKPSPLTPIVGNPAFSPGLYDFRFQDLKYVGLFSGPALYCERTLDYQIVNS